MIGLSALLVIAIIGGIAIATSRHGTHLAPTQGAGVLTRGGVPSRDHATNRPAPASVETPLQTALRQWIAAGLMTPEQANAIEQYENSMIAAMAPPAPSEHGRRVPLVAEALGYLGGTLGIVGLTLLVARYWPDLGFGGRAGLSGGASLLLAVGGYLVREEVDPSFTRLRWFLWVLSSAAGGMFAAVVAVDGFGAEAVTTIALGCAALVTIQNAGFWAGRPRPVQQALTLLAGLVLVGTAVAQFAGPVAVGWALWVVGGAMLTVGLLHLTTATPLTVGLGGAGAVAGSVFVAGNLQGAGFALSVLTALTLLGLASMRADIGSRLDRLVLLIVGAVGTYATLPGTIGYFAQGAGVLTGVVVWLFGAGLLIAAAGTLLRSPIATEVLGGAAMVAGAAITGAQSPAFASLFGIATAIGLIALGTVPGRVLLSLFGSIGLLVNVPWAISYFFPGEGRVPLLILASGAVILLVAVWLARLGGRFRSELHR